MKKIIALVICAMLIMSVTSVLADEHSDYKYTFTAVHSTATFDKTSEYKVYKDEISKTNEPVLVFDGPVNMTLSGKADYGTLFDIKLTEYSDSEIIYEPALTKQLVFTPEQLSSSPEPVLIDNGAYILSLSTKDEKGSAVIILVGEQKVATEEEPEVITPVLPENALISDWAITEFTQAYEAGLVTVELLNNNNYTRAITRSEFAHVICALLEEYGVSYEDYLKKQGSDPELKFIDTNADMKIEFVSSCGIITGTSEQYFSPFDLLTREQAAVMLTRTFKYLKPKQAAKNVPAFVDETLFSSWAKSEIYTVAGLTDSKTGSAVMGGIGGGYFSPKTSYTVEQSLISAKRLLWAII